VSPPRAVVFDLWDTIVLFPVADWQDVARTGANVLGISEEEYDARWTETYHLRQTGSIRDALRALGGDDDAVATLLELRHELTRRSLVPRAGALETIAELRARGIQVGLISVCSEEVPQLWPETAFAGVFDSTVFSCSVGLAKPDPRIYRLACGELDLAPEEAMFVGDGANDELAGAAAVGMQAVLALPPGHDEPRWQEARGWRPRIHELPQLLDLIDGRSST
jgi:putative hydrolase of the HAD superfamily